MSGPNKYTAYSNFLIKASEDAVGWAEIWGLFQPVTEYGRQYKLSMVPFTPGDESSWETTYNLLEADVKALTGEASAHQALNEEASKGATAKSEAAKSEGTKSEAAKGEGTKSEATKSGQLNKLRTQLQGLPDITPIFERESGNFSPRELLTLKQFAFYAKALASSYSSVLQDVWSPERFDELLGPFGGLNQSSFSVQHVASERYEEAAGQYTRTVQKQAEATRQWSDIWKESLGVRPNRDGTVVCSLPQQRELVQQLKTTEGVQWQQDTPFESTFLIPLSIEMEQVQSELNQWQSVMDAEAYKAITALTKTLRAHRGTWDGAAANIGALDVRTAKVKLWNEWGGCRPYTGEAPLVEGAVHPTLRHRFTTQGRRYVPLDWALSQGANVLSGSNMGGKTLAMTLVVICQLCAQYGLPIPARRFRTRLYGAIRFYAGAQTDAESGLSSFGTEVLQIREAWDGLQEAVRMPMLYCFDEPARSTNPVEGEALVVGLLRQLGAQPLGQSVILVATHFAAAVREPGVTKYRVRGLRRTNEVHWGGAQAGGAQPDGVDLDGEQADGEQMDGAYEHVDRDDVQVGGTDMDSRHGDAADRDRTLRLQALTDAMDYRVERMESSAYTQEGLQIAASLGLPDGILARSRQYVTEVNRQFGLVDRGTEQ